MGEHTHVENEFVDTQDRNINTFRHVVVFCNICKLSTYIYLLLLILHTRVLNNLYTALPQLFLFLHDVLDALGGRPVSVPVDPEEVF